MQPTVVKYIGKFRASTVNGLEFPNGVPVLVHDSKLGAELILAPDFAASDLAELESYAQSLSDLEAAPSPVAAPAAAVPARPVATPVVPAIVAVKEQA